MKYEITLRIIVHRPVSGITMQVQRGKNELLPPAVLPEGSLAFEFPIAVDLSGDSPNFLGPYTQGPKTSRFIYVNSGRQAGQFGTDCSRRAKVPLMSISADLVRSAGEKSGSLLETEFEGTGADGLPTCATVKGIEWRLASK